MVGWQRNLQSLICHVGKRASAANFSSSSSSSSYFQRLWRPSPQTIGRPLHHYFQHLGISSSRSLLADSTVESPRQSPVAPVSASDGERNEEHNQKSLSKPSQIQFVLKGIKMLTGSVTFRMPEVEGVLNNLEEMSPNKVNLVAKLVRGMRIEDALLQLQVTDKQAVKTVYQTLHSARADATYNHGLDPERLLVAGAFVGKGFLGFHKNRLYYHGQSNNGTKVRPNNYQLTVMLREITPEEKEEIARQRANNFLYLTKRLRLTKKENKFVPHQLIRNHKGKVGSSQPSGMGMTS